MIIDKILNNNVVMALNSSGEETVYMGRGLAFSKKVGDEIFPEFIEKEFILKDTALSSQLEQLFSDIPSEEVEVVKKIVDLAEEELQMELSSNIYLTLTDHIHYAIARAKEEIVLSNPLKYETRKFYPREFNIARQGIKMVNEQFDVSFSDDEAGFIAFHIVNSEQGNNTMEVTMTATEIVSNVLTIIQRYFGTLFDEDALNYQRMVTHLQFFSQRYLKDELNGDDDEFLYELIQSKYPKAFQAVQRINQFLETEYNKPIGKSEQTYLTIHIQRLVGEKNE
ncbi:PRD domain-containing protein [Enterococcus sp. BWB1-3]|uniref:BglG family transcription antiterminator LicT n=1 Tax=unclassified Enterococcus TaxID=2608891 RepID=UPI001924EB59|nr:MULTISPECIES: PRD domain-containing protein [unclassified Enterococcus]MBL1228465.1 PRD domain-containing protein [Enterococcus sp. BWB1-3]MCB5950470.1 PRD domain-containing protein [Enterococcus sp. BWT-B8]MCB5954353.1 PRD domain-containing protein [Enterococcus sp. CWB-B31]